MRVRPLAFFVARRLAALVLLLVLLSFGIFSLMYIAPGDIVQALIGARQSSPALIHQLREQYHLDDPFLTQYWIWLKAAAHFDLGRSTVTGLPVTAAIRQHFGVTLFLGIYAFILTTVFGVSLGVAAAVRKRTVADRGIVGVSVLAVSMPAFVTGIVLLYLLAVRVSWFPAYGPGTGFSDRLVHLTLPAIALALTQAALVLKLTRASMIETLDQDYVAFARARGVPARRVLGTYAFRNALIPVVTASALILAFLLTGAVLVEVTFALPGLGSLLVDSVDRKDVTTVQGLALVIAATVMLANLVTDVAYLFLDPRIRFGKGAS
ncbi:MAG TPA: ABC transporter permease [Gaiellaceae bacterium]